MKNTLSNLIENNVLSHNDAYVLLNALHRETLFGSDPSINYMESTFVEKQALELFFKYANWKHKPEDSSIFFPGLNAIKRENEILWSAYAMTSPIWIVSE